MLKVPSLPSARNSKKKINKLALLTSGGDAPGMNAAIRAVVRYAIVNDREVYGVMKGFRGLLEGKLERMVESSVANIIQRGGTILKTDRCKEFHKKAVRREAALFLRRNGIDGLVVIGGDGSFTGAHLLEEETEFPTIGVPGTIDNDIYGTEDTIGFDTAVNTALDAIDRIRDTATSHDRLFLLEVMGRSSGFIALEVGVGGGAETIIIPEEKESIGEICQTIERGRKRGKTSSIIVVAEGHKPGKSQLLSSELSKRGYSPKVCILGHTQRGGSPTAHDRMLASTLGASAVAYLLGGFSNCMVGVQNGQVTRLSFNQVIGKRREVPGSMLKLARALAI